MTLMLPSNTEPAGRWPGALAGTLAASAPSRTPANTIRSMVSSPQGVCRNGYNATPRREQSPCRSFSFLSGSRLQRFEQFLHGDDHGLVLVVGVVETQAQAFGLGAGPGIV